jgi:RimJ/RimL family protein N-acetyltransferase
MKPFPLLETDRLRLRRFHLTDAARIQELASLKEVAQGTLRLPHPYPDDAAEVWIKSQEQEYETGTSVNFAITLIADALLIGAIGLDIVAEHRHARMGYWLGKPNWGKGYATEAVKAVLAYGFTQRGLHRIYAGHFSNNPASGRVLQKAGMTYEGRLREHYVRFGEPVTLELYGILKQDFSRE